MSLENVKKFYQTIASEEALRTELSEIFEPYQGQDIELEKRNSLVEQVVLPFAAERGFDFTLEELQNYEAEMQRENASEELNMDEMEAVAGGLGISMAQCAFLGIGLTFKMGVCFFIGI